VGFRIGKRRIKEERQNPKKTILSQGRGYSKTLLGVKSSRKEQRHLPCQEGVDFGGRRGVTSQNRQKNYLQRSRNVTPILRKGSVGRGGGDPPGKVQDCQEGKGNPDLLTGRRKNSTGGTLERKLWRTGVAKGAYVVSSIRVKCVTPPPGHTAIGGAFIITGRNAGKKSELFKGKEEL